jgi:pimeloyl-ACP methyl ester carboxylesterase
VTQNIPHNKKILIVGHSMGTHLSIKLTKKLPNHKVEGMILLSMPKLFDDCQMPLTQPPKAKATSILYFFTFFPQLFNLFRCWDRITGLKSHSVTRQLSEGQQNIYNNLRQFRWNMDVDSEIVLKYVYGFTLAKYSEIVQAISQFNDNRNDSRTYEKTLLVCGKEDVMTPYKYNEIADEYLTKTFNRKVNHLIGINNAGHSIFFSKPEFICGKILDHIEHKFPERLNLSPSWVLKVKAQISGDKWGLKNELKWLKLKPISSNITRNSNSDVAPLIAMKTLREDDSNHSPKILESLFYGNDDERNKLPHDTKGNLIAIIDISSDAPPYSPKSFTQITYYKQATVSKVVPDQIAIRKFIQLVDEILNNSTVDNPLISVHCHYGFNRTGFLICCYLIERLGWEVKDAVEGFKAAKPPGIKHPHFIDALYVRYER